MASNKAKGTLFESRVVAFMAAALGGEYPVSRPPQAGRNDVGDVHVADDLVIQCKDWATWSKSSVTGWLRDVAKQCCHAGRSMGVVFIKTRREKGVSSGKTGDSIVVMSADVFSELFNGYLVAQNMGDQEKD